jgi:hypothetical protein
MMSASAFFIASVLGGVASTFPALANTITFDTAPLGIFTGPVTESGFTYSTLSGGLFVNAFGNPGQDMEGREAVGGGVLEVVSASGGDFNFNAVDFAANSSDTATSQTLQVEGLLGASVVGIDEYTLPSNSIYVTEAASVLAGKTLSELEITLNAGTTPAIFTERIDNLVLTVSVPAPSIGRGLPALLAIGGAWILHLVFLRLRGKPVKVA